MIRKSSSALCTCGKAIEWKTYFRDNNDNVFMPINRKRDNSNVVDMEKINNHFYYVQIECPDCGKRYTLTIS